MTQSLCWVHIGDLHLDAQEKNSAGRPTPWASLDRLREIVGEVNGHIGDAADFVYLPGDIANNGLVSEYQQLMPVMASLNSDWYAIPGDHDFAAADHLSPKRALEAYEALIPAKHRPPFKKFHGFHCLFLDIVSAGRGGPDFRLTMEQRNWIAEQLAFAEAKRRIPLVFMHAYPGDLAADGEEIARRFADAGVAFVDTGHTHFNELLNDGRVVYGATRSTGQIEEDCGHVGYSIVCVHGRVVCWRFRRLHDPWPHVQIVSPSDRRLVTRPSDRSHVAHPGHLTVVAKVIGGRSTPTVSIDGVDQGRMRQDAAGLWRAHVRVESGLRTIRVHVDGRRDKIEVLVRRASIIPKRRPPIALGNECHAIGAWPVAGIDGAQLGPNKNGQAW